MSDKTQLALAFDTKQYIYNKSYYNASDSDILQGYIPTDLDLSDIRAALLKIASLHVIIFLDYYETGGADMRNNL
jgi:hypothetical protein